MGAKGKAYKVGNEMLCSPENQNFKLSFSDFALKLFPHKFLN